MISIEIIKAIKTFAGYKKVSGTDKEHDYTHVILDKEYHLNKENCTADLQVGINDLKKINHDLIAKYENEIEMLIKDYEKRIYDIKSSLDNEHNKVLKNYNNLKKINDNLLRITKERANAERKLKNKKKHSGYVLYSADKYLYKMTEGYGKNTKKMSFNCWLVKMQTPYKISIESDSLLRLVYVDFRNTLCPLLNLDSIYTPNEFRSWSIADLSSKYKSGEKLIFNLEPKINANKGFWEISFLSSAAINILDEILLNSIKDNQEPVKN